MPDKRIPVNFSTSLAVSLSLLAILFSPVISQAMVQCYDCHGNRSDHDNRPIDSPTNSPTRDAITGAFPGSHRTHMAGPSGATACAKCHPGSESYASGHRNGVITLAGNINNSAIVATYNNFSGSFPQTPNPELHSCTNVNCHFEQITPKWGSTPYVPVSNCNSCHGFPPADGSHPAATGSGKKHQAYYGASGSCSRCHFDHLASESPFAHATSAGKRGLAVVFATPPNNGGNYSGDVSYATYLHKTAEQRNGSCTNLYCHSNGNDGPPLVVPVWGGSLPTDCSGCHSFGGAATSLSGRHDRHTDAERYRFTCERCHKDSVDGANTIINTGLHVNRVKDVAFRDGGAYGSDKSCSNTYCHSDGRNGAPVKQVKWSDSATQQCNICHKGTASDNTAENCAAIQGVWSSGRGYCTPSLTMASNGHDRLVGQRWIRKYPCSYCHNATVAQSGTITSFTRHLNGDKDIVFDPKWNIVGRPDPTYNPVTKVCSNVYCHSDGTTNPDVVRPFAWTEPKTSCNSCHGHPREEKCSNAGCHDGRVDAIGKVWLLPAIFGNKSSYRWPLGQEWKAALPMFPNLGAGNARANSHPRHTETNFTCDECHAATIINGSCTSCHTTGIPPGSMTEVAHLNGAVHVNKTKDVVFKQGGSYNSVSKVCSNTACHVGGTDPVWGGSVNNSVICLGCHGTSNADQDSYVTFNGTRARINLTQWYATGHGRYSTSGRYPVSGNPAANFPGNPCWYCHDNTVLHNDDSNVFRLRKHPQFANRFEKECVYCHMSGLDSECLSCHNNSESLAKQLVNIPANPNASWPDGTPANCPDHATMVSGQVSCITAQCHFIDPANPTHDIKLHNSGAGLWTKDQKEDVRNQYVMMGVCLKCHDDDSSGECTSCHTAPANNPMKYAIGFDPGTGFIKPKKARASSAHFGYKHYREYKANGAWKGGKFCWDCHDPHGDSNIYMIHDQVATVTDGKSGLPLARAQVSFTRKQSGLDYARTVAPYNGICNVCHALQGAKLSKHYGSDYGDGHNSSRVCTNCHQHRFTDSHAENKPCNSCHNNKPVPRHSAFGQPRTCTTCHTGTVGNRVDVMGQFNGTSHHVQGVAVSSKQCYACHWESTPEGLIDVKHHEGYNYKTYTSVKNAKVDLVIWGPGTRPTSYRLYSTVIQYTPAVLALGNITSERQEVAKITNHCLSCHSDQNNNTQPFGDCKTPRQYSWDRQSVAARYSQTGTTSWGKYQTNGKGSVTKALSAHGNAVANQGGFDPNNGTDQSFSSTRSGAYNVTCYDCHNSHGSRVVGTTSSYVTFNGTKNGANLKETQAGKGGYTMSYKASANLASGAVNPYSAGAGQCFDCHLTKTRGTTPWGYQSTFGASQSIKGYMDSDMFGATTSPYMDRYPYKSKPVAGGHLKATSYLNHSTAGQNKINGLCTPCHDPHGTSPTLGSKQAYAVPMLKGTWMTTPYREDAANPATGGTASAYADIRQIVTEDDSKFAGLCLRCHYKNNLTNGTDHTWKSPDRVHESVKGWKTANGTIQHTFTCSKCHAPHTSELPRLMVTNCLDFNHQGRKQSGGQAGSGSCTGCNEYSGNNGAGYGGGSFPLGGGEGGASASYQVNCHPTGVWPDNTWNNKTQW
ncbi:CxxxxCH/CxxCH domain c-type cytochrome [Citrifermentans pelophilum]|nr:CxxxxCH/CxxCH domain-containing protein [Geoanaerobacter pelophilus]